MDYICTRCDYVGKRRKMMRGSRAVEVFLWLVFLIPGPFYSIWRLLSKKWACPMCGEEVMVPVRSDLGQEHVKKVESDITPEELAKIPDMWEEDRKKYAAKYPEQTVVIKKETDDKNDEHTKPEADSW